VAVAGPNGAGKSTFYNAYLKDIGLRFVNADVLAKQFRIDAYPAAALADSIRRELVERPESFVFETVFSDPEGGKLKFLQETAKAGFTVVLCFIGTSAAQLSESRVAMRVSQGGHDVPTDKLTERYPRILKNLQRALRTLPLIWVFDNSDLENSYRLVARIVDGKPSTVHHPLPEWLKGIWSRTQE
jgi:predicted ABC-type ATPase